MHQQRSCFYVVALGHSVDCHGNIHTHTPWYQPGGRAGRRQSVANTVTGATRAGRYRVRLYRATLYRSERLSGWGYSARRVPRDLGQVRCHTRLLSCLAELASIGSLLLKAPTDQSEWIVAVEAIGAKLIEVGWRASDDQSQVVRLAADFADTDEWALGGYSTPGRWIADKLDIARRTANEWIRVGRCYAFCQQHRLRWMSGRSRSVRPRS